MFGILDRYVGRTLLLIVGLTSLVLVLITAIITFIDQTRHIGKGDIDFIFLIWYIILLMPSKFILLFPVALLLGGVIGLGLLAKSSELVIMQASGLSKFRIILSALKTLFPVIIVISVLGQTVTPKIDQYAESRFQYFANEGKLSRTNWGFWVREGNSFLSVRRAMSDNSIHEITRYDFDGINLLRISSASSGYYIDGKWHMKNVNHLNYQEQSINKEFQKEDVWTLYLTPERLAVFNLKSEELGILELIDYIHYLESNNIDSTKHKIALYKKFLTPLVMVVMLLLGSSTVFGSIRSVSMSARIIVGIAFGFSFYLANEIIPNFILVAGVPIIIGVMLPLLIFGGISFFLLNRKV